MRARDNLVRSLLLSIPLLLIYYWNAAAQWRFEWISRPTHLRIWNVPGGCLPMDHYPLADWLLLSGVIFALLSLISWLMRALG